MAEQPVDTVETVDNPFASPSSNSDVVLVVEGRKLHVCKGILADVSPVFERMFYGEFKEKDSQEVQLTDKDHDEIVEFLLGIYPSRMKKVTKQTVGAVMMLADEYQVQLLFDSCLDFLLNGGCKFTMSEMIHFLHISENHDNLSKVHDYFLEKVARHYCWSYTNEEEFSELSYETQSKVFKERLYLYETDEYFHSKNKPTRCEKLSNKMILY